MNRAGVPACAHGGGALAFAPSPSGDRISVEPASGTDNGGRGVAAGLPAARGRLGQGYRQVKSKYIASFSIRLGALPTRRIV